MARGDGVPGHSRTQGGQSQGGAGVAGGVQSCQGYKAVLSSCQGPRLRRGGEGEVRYLHHQNPVSEVVVFRPAPS